MRTIYICTDSVPGIYSGIYDAWKQAVVNRQEGCGIALKGQVEQELFCEYTEVEEDLKKAAAVDRLIWKNMGERARRDFSYALLSEDPEKGNAVLGTMFAARTIADSQKIMEHLSHPMVEKVFELSRAVGGEAHNFKGFLRFRELENGVLYAAIRPRARVLPCLAPHFQDRLPGENWMIHDQRHGQYVIHEAGKNWVMVQQEPEGKYREGRGDAEEEFLTQVSDAERQYARLWRGFCRAISIEERRNPACQLQHLPFRYRDGMTEFLAEEFPGVVR